jgi:hypothetical protein
MKCDECKYRLEPIQKHPCYNCKHKQQRMEDFFEPIKDEPVSEMGALAIWDKDEHKSSTEGGIFLDGFQAGTENQRKRNRPNQSFADVADDFFNHAATNQMEMDALEYGWKACEKSHGLED